MAVTLLAGAEPSTNNTNNNVRDMAYTVYQLEPDQAPLVRLMTALSSKNAINPKIEWNEDEAMPRITTLSASAASNATAIGVAADIFRVNDVIRFTTQGFAMYVTATAAGAITASAIGGVAQASAASGATGEVYIVGPSDAEGASLREIKYPQLVTASNYCEIFRTPFGVTGTEEATEHYGGDERKRLQAKFGVEHARAIEQTFWLGARDLKNTNQRFCGGIIKEFIATNTTAAGGALTEATFQGFLRAGFRYGADRKVLFAAPLVIQAIEGFARANLKVNDNRAETYGVSMKTYVSGQGIVDIVKKLDWNDSAVLNGYAVLLDMDSIFYRPLQGRDTKLNQNVQAPDYDGFKDEYKTEASIQVTHERRHSLLTGVTG